MVDGVALLVAVLLLAGNAFFVGAEFSLIAARRTQIEPRAAQGSRAARLTLRAMEQVSLMMAGAQLGITVCSLGLGAIAEPAVSELIAGPLDALGVPASLSHPIAFTVAIVIVVCLHIVLGEMMPKNIAIAGPERAATVLGPLLYGIVLVLKPVIVALNWLANIALRALRVPTRDEVTSSFTAQEVAAFIAESRREGLLDAEEHELLRGALAISGVPTAAVAVPADELVVLPEGATVTDAEEVCVRTGFSRFPIASTQGELVGYVHLKDLLDTHPGQVDRPIPARLVRPLVDVPAATPLDETLARMQARGAHLARVVDGGRMVGIAMLEDVVERLVGEVADAASQAGSQVGGPLSTALNSHASAAASSRPNSQVSEGA